MRLGSVAALAVSAFALPDPAAAEIRDCTVISTVPAVIATPGLYCLKSDLMTGIASGNAITVNANFVTLDLNGWRLGGGAAGGATNAYGIRVLDRRGVTIRNGSVKGFFCGVAFENSGNGTANLVEDIRADGNTQFGIYMGSSYSVIRNNLVSNTGGRTVGTWDEAWGIRSTGIGNQILNNSISGSVATKASSTAYGIDSAGANAVLVGNRISDLHSTLYWTEGILATASSVLVDNQITGASGSAEFGIDALGSSIVARNRVSAYANGIYVSSGVYSGNVVVGATPAYSGGAVAHGTTNWPTP